MEVDSGERGVRSHDAVRVWRKVRQHGGDRVLQRYILAPPRAAELTLFISKNRFLFSLTRVLSFYSHIVIANKPIQLSPERNRSRVTRPTSPILSMASSHLQQSPLKFDYHTETCRSTYRKFALAKTVCLHVSDNLMVMSWIACVPYTTVQPILKE